MIRSLVLTCLILLATSSAVRADTFGSAANTFDIEFVAIGNPGNMADTTGNPNPAGKVAFSYRIGKYEVSEKMIDNANALGGLDIIHSVRGADKPATLITWNEAARFVNWLNTSTGGAPAYKFALQPGDSGYFANADIQLWAPSDAGYNPSDPYRNSLARYFLPNVDEWYKAAYYDPSTSVYYDYPTGSNSPPGIVASGTGMGTAVYGQFTNADPADVFSAGGLSPYGTMGQGGNVWEWEETEFDRVNDSPQSQRAFRGGAFYNAANSLWPSERIARFPSDQLDVIGFRIASTVVPEPSTLALAFIAFSASALADRRSRRRNRRSNSPSELSLSPQCSLRFCRG